LHAEDIVVHGEQTHSGGGGTGGGGILQRDGDLRVVDAAEVARARRLVLLRLQGERVAVHTRHRGTGVVLSSLDRVEVLTGHGFHSVLAVQDQSEFGERTRGVGRIGHTTLAEKLGRAIETELNERAANVGRRHESVGSSVSLRRVRFENDAREGLVPGEVPEGRLRRGRGTETPDQFLDRVVERKANVLGSIIGDRVNAGVLHLRDEVLVTLLREASAFFGVEVEVVSPDLETGRSEVGLEVAREIEIEADFVVLQGNERKGQTRVRVEGEHERKVHLRGGTRDTGGHLRPVLLGRGVQVQFGVESPPLLVDLVQSLPTNREFDVLDGTLGDPVAVSGRRLGRQSRDRGEFEVHLTDQVTIAGDGHRDPAVVSGGTVDSLFDSLLRKIRVPLVDSLEKSYFWVACKINILSSVRDELHETSGHCSVVCNITGENNSRPDARDVGGAENLPWDFLHLDQTSEHDRP